MNVNITTRTIRSFIAFTIFVLALSPSAVSAQSTTFNYQGRLIQNSLPATGNFDFTFALYDAESGGVLIDTQQTTSVSVANGIFSVELDFGPAFAGPPRWLEISVKPAGDADPPTLLTPRRPINSAPYAIKSLNAESAETAADADNLGGVAASQFVVTTDPRMTDARDPLPNSPNYIRNSTTRQTAANINISGTASFGSHGDFGGVLSTSSNLFVVGNSTLQGNLTVNGALTANLPAGDSSYVQNRTSTQTGTNFNISGTGTANIFAATQFTGGNFSGALYNGSVFNSTGGFFQDNVRILNTPGTNNTFAGRLSGSANTGTNNSFFGFNAGNDNTSADNNAFFGSEAGAVTTTGGINTFLGSAAGKNNVTGSENTFVGTSAGFNNDGGNQNTFVGRSAGRLNSGGTGNTFVGFDAGRANTSSHNSFFGYQSGENNGLGTQNSFFGLSSGRANTSGHFNSFFGGGAGNANTTGDFNAFFGTGAGDTNMTGNNNTAIGYDANMSTSGLTYATAIGSGARVTSSNSITLGRTSDTVRIPGTLNLSGTTVPSLIVSGDITATGTGYFGHVRSQTGFIETLRAGLNQGGGGSEVCEATSATGVLAYCSSSRRYKRDVSTFLRGMEVVARLRPVTFVWKNNDQLDLGFVAEEVAEIDPLLATFDTNGTIEGVKYRQLTTVLVNAVKEQQTQIDDQTKELAEQRKLIAELKALVCAQNAQATVCK
jgi:hypothetical protein